MDRFLSNTINRVDKKGRVSIPAGFRTVLAGQSKIHILMGIDNPVVEAGGPKFMDANLKRLEAMDPFSEEYEMWAFCLLGDADEIRLDGEGRIILTDQIRAHTGIIDEVAFVGRGHFFQMWEPERFQAYRSQARARVSAMRRSLGSQQDNSHSPESRAEPLTPPLKGSGSGQQKRGKGRQE